MTVPQKAGFDLPADAHIPLLDIYPMDVSSYNKDTHTNTMESYSATTKYYTIVYYIQNVIQLCIIQCVRK